MRMRIKPKDGAWYWIPGFEGRYTINCHGDVRRVEKKNEQAHEWITVHGKNHHEQYVWLYDDDNKRIKVSLTKLMKVMFFGLGDEWKMYHKDGVVTNNDIENLVPMTRSQIGKAVGGKATRRPVAHIR